MNNIVQRVIDVTGQYRACSDLDVEVASVDVLALPTNTAPVEFEGDTGSPVPWQPGEWHSFGRINLALLRVRGQAGDRVTVVGGTW
ncbi:MAG: hypothetical protein H0V44_11265 [Planctomycetes bacterium]|nr:hypothetical protein [Planctomycetota bacterium]MBA3707363.1 hypothetical protein [Planctomycetota bacterium]